MAFDVQVVIDCSRPHEQADWWAEALGWQVEQQDEAFIRRMVESGAASEADTTRHRGALVWKVGAAITSPDPDRPRVLFQSVPEPKTVKNRIHWDVETDDVQALLDRGATLLRGPDDDIDWHVLADPEGNEFCVFGSG
jgi:hypothetical protein